MSVNKNVNAAEQSASDKPAPQEKRRTVGNKVFDWFVYPFIAFGAVFAFSVWATKEGRYGTGWVNAQYNKLAQWISDSPLLSKVPEGDARFKAAKDQAMVAVSFIAGTLIITPIKWFEDSRNAISKFIDRVLGTTPKDPSQYVKEPVQSWKSILLGRVLTFGSVLAVDKVVGGHIINWSGKVASKLTGTAVDLKLGQDAGASSRWQTAFVGAFEAFYTAFCAVMVYGLSRSIARYLNKGEAPREGLGTAVSDAAKGIEHGQVNYFPEGEQVAQQKQASTWTDKTGRSEPAKKRHGFTRAIEGVAHAPL